MNVYKKDRQVQIYVETHKAANLSNNRDGGGNGGRSVAVSVSLFSSFVFFLTLST